MKVIKVWDGEQFLVEEYVVRASTNQMAANIYAQFKGITIKNMQVGCAVMNNGTVLDITKTTKNKAYKYTRI